VVFVLFSIGYATTTACPFLFLEIIGAKNKNNRKSQLRYAIVVSTTDRDTIFE